MYFERVRGSKNELRPTRSPVSIVYTIVALRILSYTTYSFSYRAVRARIIRYDFVIIDSNEKRFGIRNGRFFGTISLIDLYSFL